MNASLHHTAYTADQVREAEERCHSRHFSGDVSPGGHSHESVDCDSTQTNDEMMQRAAHRVYQVATTMVERSHNHNAGRILLLVGKGGNGGDALYAGAELAMAGHTVDAWLIFGDAHERALRTFRDAGGHIVDQAGAPDSYALVIDGILGLGGAGNLPENLAPVLDGLREHHAQILAVDVPSGIAADTGERAEGHVTADVTITFGGWRRAHGLAPECGIQLLADVGVGEQKLSDELSEVNGISIYRASGSQLTWPDGILPLGPAPIESTEPGFYDDKYTGGVVGIRAGSGTYPGAPILCVAGAVAATPGMVRYAGPQALEVVRAHPEVIATETLDQAGRVQAWAFGPGAGTDDEARRELEWVLGEEVPLLIDADGLTLLEKHSELRKMVTQRSTPTVVTPHDGEFSRLRQAVGLPESDRHGEAVELAAQLRCVVVRKGRATIVAHPDGSSAVVDAGNSWAATPGSGDVLAGILGARMARDSVPDPGNSATGLHSSICIHGLAAQLAASTPWGEAQTHAREIARHIRGATAQLQC